MKDISIFLVTIICFVFYSCEQEPIEAVSIEEIEVENEDYQAKWFGYCNSFKAKVRFTHIFDWDPRPASITGTLIMENCSNGNRPCTQIISLPVRNNKQVTFYSLGSEFKDSDRFRIRIIPNEDGFHQTFFTRLSMGSAYGKIKDLGVRQVGYSSSIYDDVSFDFPDVCE